MSAAQQPAFLYSVRRLTELEAIQRVSRRMSVATEPQTGMRALAEIVLQTNGITALLLEPSSELVVFDIGMKWGDGSGPGPQGCAVAPIRAGSRDWGQIRIYFDLRAKALESPLPFARFLGQQIASLLNRCELEQRRHSLRSRLERLRIRLATRKLVQRGAGIIAQSRGVSEADARGFLRKYSREFRRSLYQVAEAVVLSQEDAWNLRPVWRRLQPGELTFESWNGRNGKPAIPGARR